MERRLDRHARALAGATALAGGAVLLALMLMTCASIMGRALVSLGLRPVPGDYELVELGTAFAVFSFLPWCQYRRGHVTVDVFVARAGPRMLAGLSVIGNVLATLLYVLIAWRLWEGMFDKMRFQESSYILALPLWWVYAAAVPGAVGAALVGAFTVLRSLAEMLGAGEPVLQVAGDG